MAQELIRHNVLSLDFWQDMQQNEKPSPAAQKGESLS